MFYILDKTGQLVATADQAPDEDDLAAHEYQTIESSLELPLSDVEVTGFPNKPKLIEKKQAARMPTINLKSNAKDTDGDGIPELPADGQSKATITASIKDASGKLQRKSLELFITTSAGALSARRIKTRDGKASFELTSSHDTVLATVNVSAQGYDAEFLQFEFMPPK